MLKSQLVDISPEQEKAKKAEEVERIKTQLADERMRPFLFALVDNELGRLDKLAASRQEASSPRTLGEHKSRKSHAIPISKAKAWQSDGQH